MLGGILMTVLFLIALFLILLVLVQRGRGGGLAGAFGGMGGQSAFGTKAGDLFTRITIVAASLWIVLCAVSVKYYNQDETFDRSLGSSSAPADGKGQPRPGATPAAPNAPPADGKSSPTGTAPAAGGSATPPDATPPAAPPPEKSQGP